MFSSSSSSSILFLSNPNNFPTLNPRKSLNFPGKKNRASSSSVSSVSSCSCSFSSSTMASSVSFYEVLGISMGASCNEIKAAYRKLARTCHPDVVAMNQKETSASEFMKIHSAYSTLSDPNKRAQYDREIIYTTRRTPLNSANINKAASSMASSGFHRFTHSSMKWETDQCW